MTNSPRRLDTGLESLVGRADDAIGLLDAIGAGRSVVLSGDAGIGKTTLVEHVVDEAERRWQFVVWRVFANEVLRDVPHGALTASLPVAVLDGPLGVVAGFRATVAAQDGPVLVWVDDAPDLDGLSAQAIASVLADRAAIVIATRREGAPLPDPLARHASAGRFELRALGPLPRDEVALLARSVAGRPVASASIDFVHRMTRGNPRFVRSLIAASMESHASSVDHEPLVVDSVPSGTNRLADLVRDLLVGLDADEAEALHAIAATSPVGVRLLDGLVDAVAIERLGRRRVVQLDVEQRRVVARMGHPLLREALRLEAPVESSRWELAVARAIRAAGGRRADDAVRVAIWLLRNGGDPDTSVLMDGCRRATAEGDFAVAIELGQAAFERQPDFETGQALEFALRKHGHPDPLDAHLLVWGQYVSTGTERAAYLSAIGHASFFRHGDVDTARRLLAESDEFDDASAASWLRAIAACTLMMAGESQAALAVAEPIFDGLLDAEPGEGLIYATIARAHALSSLGRPADALAVCDRSITAFRPNGPYGEFVAHGVVGNVRAQALTLLGRFDEAEQTVRRAIELGRAASDPTTLGLAYFETSDLARHRDDHERAISFGERAMATLDEGHQVGMARASAIGIAQAAALQGDRRRAEDALAEARERASGTMAVLDSGIDRAETWLAWQRGDIGAARERSQAAVEHAAATGNVANQILALHDLARVGDPNDAARGLEDLQGDVQGDLLRTHVDAIRARARGAPTEVANCAERFGVIGCRQLAAECAELAADAFGRAGRRTDANEWLARAARWRESLGPTVSPWRAGSPITELSARQREIAVQAAAGATSRTIAERLSISPRTVESHLARVYTALGVHDRAALARVLNEATR